MADALGAGAGESKPEVTPGIEVTPPVTDPATPPAEPAAPEGWQKHIPDTHKDAAFWKNFSGDDAGLGNLLKSHAEQQRLVGSKLAVPEAGDATGWNDLYNKLGRPETSDGYKVVFHDYDGQLNWNEDSTKAISAQAHALGLNNEQLQGLVGWYGQLQIETQVEQSRQQAAALGELRDSYGPVADRKFAQANNLLNRAGGQELLEAITSSGLGGNAVFVKAMVHLTEQMNEDDTVLTEVGGLTSKDDALAKIKEIRADKEHPFHKKDASAVKEMQRLYTLAYE